MSRELDAFIAEKVMGLTLVEATKEASCIIGGCRITSGVNVHTGEVHEWGPVVRRIKATPHL